MADPNSPPALPLIPTPHQGVRDGIKIETTWKGEEKRGRNKEKGRERTRKMSREGWG